MTPETIANLRKLLVTWNEQRTPQSAADVMVAAALALPELLDELERWPVKYAAAVAEAQSAITKYQDAMDERRVPEGMESVIEWARKHPEFMWQENQRNENEVTRLDGELEAARAALDRYGSHSEPQNGNPECAYLRSWKLGAREHEHNALCHDAVLSGDA